MTESDLTRLETALGLTLPARYRQFALSLPNDIDDDEAAHRYPFMDVDALIVRNTQLRSGDWVEGWQPNLLCIGTFEGGDFFIDPIDLSKGVFLNTLDESDDGRGAPYDQNDYSPCWIHSFDELINPGPKNSPSPEKWTGFLSAWFAGEEDGTFTIAKLDKFSMEAVEAEVRSMDGFRHAEVLLYGYAVSTPYSPVDFAVSGGHRGYFMKAVIGTNSFHFWDPRASSVPVKIVPVEPEIEFPGQAVCYDVEVVLAALCHFNKTGELLQAIQWKQAEHQSEVAS